MRHQRLLTVIIASVIALLMFSGTIILNFTDLEWRGVIGVGPVRARTPRDADPGRCCEPEAGVPGE